MRVWLREKRGNLTQEEVAKSAGMSRAQYSRIESNTRNPSVQSAKSLGKVLKFPWWWFYENSVQGKSPPQ